MSTDDDANGGHGTNGGDGEGKGEGNGNGNGNGNGEPPAAAAAGAEPDRARDEDAGGNGGDAPGDVDVAERTGGDGPAGTATRERPERDDSADRPRHLAKPARREGPLRRLTGRRPAERRPGGVRWLAPAVLAAVTLGAGGGALTLSGDDAAAAVGVGEATETPVLSARRVPDLLAEPVAERRLAAELDAWLASSPPDTCLVVEDQGETVYAHNATHPVTGASTQKLLTATALLMALGPDAHLETTVATASAPEGGVVAGDLFLVGGGDALLGTTAWRDHFTREPHTVDDIDRLAQAIVDAGVRRIDGGVVGDASRYESATYHPSWPQRFAQQLVVGPIAGLTVNDGFASFSGPATPGAPNRLAADPAADAGRVLTDLLRLRGVTVAGQPRAGRVPDDAHEVASLRSPPLSDVVADMLANSDNETAEAALKEVGRVEAGEGSWGAGAAAVRDLLDRAGVTLDGVTIDDGSGLSIGNRLTCETLVDVLTRPETGPVVREGLAVAGESGTLADQWTGTPVAGHLRAKTGTLRNVTALAGEVDLTQGGTLTFAYVANVPDPNEVSQFSVGLDRLPSLLMAYPRDVDVAQLQPLPAG